MCFKRGTGPCGTVSAVELRRRNAVAEEKRRRTGSKVMFKVGSSEVDEDGFAEPFDPAVERNFHDHQHDDQQQQKREQQRRGGEETERRTFCFNQGRSVARKQPEPKKRKAMRQKENVRMQALHNAHEAALHSTPQQQLRQSEDSRQVLRCWLILLWQMTKRVSRQ